ncbi:hypothetical protein [Methylacidimicrobium sp. B4]|uniref:hypothetical protein n=1 Tax=Methylacidimicrobium sp. B4 TaxID=2796139 RepID=UPI001A8F4C9F|nr:hypothetical protein [Methylacidimicrobium sp. B4]QSR84983.1 hypothetical protein MacB4_01555 [Methylacidimicrobium sp. B4]
MIGSKDETARNQSCQASVEDDGGLTLRLRLPDALASDGKLLVIPGVRFTDGQEEILRALAASRVVFSQPKTGHPVRKREGVAVSYRFLRGPEGLAALRERPDQARSHCDEPSGGIAGDRHLPRPSGRGGDGPLRHRLRAMRIDLNLHGANTLPGEGHHRRCGKEDGGDGPGAWASPGP